MLKARKAFIEVIACVKIELELSEIVCQSARCATKCKEIEIDFAF